MRDDLDERGVPLFAGRPTPDHSGLSWFCSWLFGIVVVAILIGLALPAFFPSRHSWSRQMQCMSNIRQMGLGVQGYHYEKGLYPTGTVDNSDLPLDRSLGWGFRILPYIDQAQYLSERDKTVEEAARLPWDDPVYNDLIAHPPGITHCSENFEGPTSYAAIASLGADAPTLPVNHRRAGIFGDNRRVTAAHVKDGASTTIMLVESSSLTGPWFAGGRNTVRGVDPAQQPYFGSGRPFGGNHPGAVIILLADGSCRSVSESIDPRVFEAMNTMAGGEKVSDNWYQ